MITQTDPGELFICRNAGNIVPPHSTQTGGMTASIEFAVGVLKVPHIVICGHTECGAMKGALNRDSLTHLPHVREWLGYAKAAVDIVQAVADGQSDDEKMLLLLEQNVLLQLQHLKTHPTVAVAIAQGTLELHGWVYDIKTGDVHAYDAESNRFLPVDQRYAAQVTAHMAHTH